MQTSDQTQCLYYAHVVHIHYSYALPDRQIVIKFFKSHFKTEYITPQLTFEALMFISYKCI